MNPLGRGRDVPTSPESAILSVEADAVVPAHLPPDPRLKRHPSEWIGSKRIGARAARPGAVVPCPDRPGWARRDPARPPRPSPRRPGRRRLLGTGRIPVRAAATGRSQPRIQAWFQVPWQAYRRTAAPSPALLFQRSTHMLAVFV